MSYRKLSSPELVKEWRRIVNDNVSMGRDSHMIKVFMADHGVCAAQLLLGIYQYENSSTINIPQFLGDSQNWLVGDEWEAEVELAVCLSHHMPPSYYVYHDLKDEEPTSVNYLQFTLAKQELSLWKDRILS